MLPFALIWLAFPSISWQQHFLPSQLHYTFSLFPNRIKFIRALEEIPLKRLLVGATFGAFLDSGARAIYLVEICKSNIVNELGNPAWSRGGLLLSKLGVGVIT